MDCRCMTDVEQSARLLVASRENAGLRPFITGVVFHTQRLPQGTHAKKQSRCNEWSSSILHLLILRLNCHLNK